MNNQLPQLIQTDLQLALKQDLRAYTFARIGLPKAGFSTSISEVLSFRADHAIAKDAIFTAFQVDKLKQELESSGWNFLEVSSCATNKAEYLQRPDLGRTLAANGLNLLTSVKGTYDVAVIVTDGLSAQAVNLHAAPLLQLLCPKLINAGLTMAPIVLLHNGRIAAADVIGEALNATLSLILVGERPGLSSPDSMGAYLTYAPKAGLTDESRNCVSNIRPLGLPCTLASDKLFYLISESLRKKISGVDLKDEMGFLEK